VAFFPGYSDEADPGFMASSISTVAFSELAANLQKVAAWLGDLGIDERRTRLGDYRRVMQQLADAHAHGDKDALRAMWPSSMVPLFEAEELVGIHQWLSGPQHNGYVRDRIRIVASGPPSYTDENTSSGNRARNTAFELAIAARIVGGGLQLDHSVPSDVAVRVAAYTVVVECKRPQSEDSLERNVDDARHQLRNRYKSANRSGCVGIIAVDLTKILNPNHNLLRGVPEAEIGEVLSGALEDYSREHERVWQKNRDRQTAAVLLRLNVMAQLADETGLTSCQQVLVSFLPDISEGTRRAIELVGGGFVRAIR
jgi:hypothetical protein